MMLRFLLIVLVVSLVAAASALQRILFIGNSSTYWHDGLYRNLKKLAAVASPTIVIETQKLVQGAILSRRCGRSRSPGR